MSSIPKGHVGQRIAIIGLLAAASFSPVGATTQEAYLKASNNHSGMVFGCSVAISGTNVIVGACAENTGAGSSGAAYVSRPISSRPIQMPMISSSAHPLAFQEMMS
jgi:hypothetical protein